MDKDKSKKKESAKEKVEDKEIKIKKPKKKIKKNITTGIAFVNATFNNTIVTIADDSGNVIAWSSAGSKGFKGSRKSTPYAAQIAADHAASKAQEHGLKVLTVQARGFKILSIKDTTPMPHNGSRPPK